MFQGLMGDGLSSVRTAAVMGDGLEIRAMQIRERNPLLTEWAIKLVQLLAPVNRHGVSDPHVSISYS